jgi:Xaa-Pro aminopeptidase
MDQPILRREVARVDALKAISVDTLIERPSDRTEIPRREFQARAQRVAEEAAARDLDGVLVWSKGGATVDRYADVLYLTNHYSQVPHLPDVPPLWAGRSFSACFVSREGETTLLLDVFDWRRDIVVADDVLFSTDLPRAVADLLTGLTLQKARIGLAAAETMPLIGWQTLISHLPSVEWVPADDILERLRVIKSEAELNVLRLAAAVGGAAMTAMLEAVQPGATEAEVAAACVHTAVSLGAAPYSISMASGARSKHTHYGSLPSWSQRRLEQGDLWRADMYGSYHGYYYDFARSTVVGEAPSAAQLEVLEGAIGLIYAILDVLRVGVTFGDLYDAGMAFLREHDFEQRDEDLASQQLVFPSFGHSIGLMWEGPWILPENPAPVEANMCLAVEGAVARDGVGGATFEQNVIVTDEGVELLSTTRPRPWAAES